MWPASSKRFKLGKVTKPARVVFGAESLSVSDENRYRSGITYSGTELSDWLETFAAAVDFKQTSYWSVVIAQQCTRLFSCSWGPQLRTADQFLRYTQIEFERRFALANSDWHIEPSQLAPNRTTLFCAYPKALVASLADLQKRSAFRMKSLMPYALAELDLVQFDFANNARSTDKTLYLGSGVSTRPALLIQNYAVLDAVMVPSSVQNSSHIKQIISSRFVDSSDTALKASGGSLISRFCSVLGNATNNQKLVAMGLPVQATQQAI